MRVTCTFCGKHLSSHRGLTAHLRCCKPVKKGPSTLKRITVPDTIYINQNCSHESSNNDESVQSDSSVSMNMCDGGVIDIEDSNIRIENDILKRKIFRCPRRLIEIKLLKFCEDIGAPIYAYDKLMMTLSNCNITANTFEHDFTRRSVLVDQLKCDVDMKDCAPVATEVTLQSGKQVKVMTCPLIPSIKSLLNDPRCMIDENLTFPCDNPMNSPVETGRRDELHSGSWYRDTWKEKCRRSGDFLLALYLFIDKTFTDVYGRLNFEPVQFTLSLFNRKTRNQYHAWRTLGYVNDLKTINHEEPEEDDMTINNDMPKLKDSEVNIRDYHAILQVILKDLQSLQREGKLSYNLDYKGDTYNLNFITVLGPIIGDTSGHDVLVGR